MSSGEADHAWPRSPKPPSVYSGSDGWPRRVSLRAVGPRIPPPMPSNPGARGTGAGRNAVLAMVGLAAVLACFAVWFQWNQTRRCLSLYGPAAARAIQAADRVELWSLAEHGGRLQAEASIDVSRAPGLVHLRRGLVEDANFSWNPAPPGRLRADAWDTALAFFDGAARRPTAVVALDLDDAGWLTMVGRPGRIGLGRLADGLRTWIRSTTGAERP